MNLDKMLEDQKDLDTAIFKNAGITEYPLENIKLALLTEIGELANEWQGFKYWKKGKAVNRKRLLDEFADCLHFSLSLENVLHQVSQYVIKNLDEIIKMLDVQCQNKDIIEGFKLVFGGVLNIQDDSVILLNIIALGRYLDISLDEMESCYYKKHKENYLRQENGY